jgi:hypothetical protein
MELQVEAACAQWMHPQEKDREGTSMSIAPLSQSSLPDEAQRMADAERDAVAGGAKGQGRIQDTHFLGDQQWDYCRAMAKLAGLYDDETESYLAMNKALYDYAGKARKDMVPGGPDTYRSLVFHRDQPNRRFDVLDASLADANAATGQEIKTISFSVPGKTEQIAAPSSLD